MSYGKHGKGWQAAFSFSSEEDRKEQVEEKLEVLEGFRIRHPEQYLTILNKAKTPVALDRACRSIVEENL